MIAEWINEFFRRLLGLFHLSSIPPTKYLVICYYKEDVKRNVADKFLLVKYAIPIRETSIIGIVIPTTTFFF